jgi:chromate reductase
MNLQHQSIRHILALPGSLRAGSYNRRLLEAAMTCAPSGLRIELYEGLTDVPMFNEDTEAGQIRQGGVRRLRDAVAAADGLLIATPEYNQSLPGVLKNAIDWLSRPAPGEVLAGKPVAIAGVSAGRWGTRLAQAALRHTLTATEAHVMPAPMLFLAEARKLFDDAGALRDPAARDGLRAWLDAFLRWIERIQVEHSPVLA